MTFIASVIAQKGVAIIADSLVTTSRHIIEFEDLREMLKKKVTGSGRGRRPSPQNVTLKISEINALFKSKPSYTKNYEEKLFKYDNYIAITTAGLAAINKKRIGKIVNDIITKNKKDRTYARKKTDEKIDAFIEYLKPDIVEHIKKSKIITSTVFVFTHFNKTDEKTSIFKLKTKEITLEQYTANPNIELVEKETFQDLFKVVCEGQNRISERILWGELEFLYYIVPRILGKVIEDFPEMKGKITSEYINQTLTHNDISNNGYIDQDVKMRKLTNLSLQQAVDLACLLMKIEVDIQKFTENIQTVGGVIKLAVIDNKGFRFVSGDEIEIPNGV